MLARTFTPMTKKVSSTWDVSLTWHEWPQLPDSEQEWNQIWRKTRKGGGEGKPSIHCTLSVNSVHAASLASLQGDRLAWLSNHPDGTCLAKNRHKVSSRLSVMNYKSVTWLNAFVWEAPWKHSVWPWQKEMGALWPAELPALLRQAKELGGVSSQVLTLWPAKFEGYVHVMHSLPFHRSLFWTVENAKRQQ